MTKKDRYKLCKKCQEFSYKINSEDNPMVDLCIQVVCDHEDDEEQLENNLMETNKWK